MKWDEKKKLKKKVLVNELKLDSQTGTLLSTDVYRGINLSYLFWIEFIFIIDFS